MERITTPFGFFSTAADVAEGIDISGKQMVITGGASGIGLETARTFSVFLATSPLLQGVSGCYFEDCNEALVVTNGNGYASGVAPYALNPDNADRLWAESLRLLG